MPRLHGYQDNLFDGDRVVTVVIHRIEFDEWGRRVGTPADPLPTAKVVRRSWWRDLW